MVYGPLVVWRSSRAMLCITTDQPRDPQGSTYPRHPHTHARTCARKSRTTIRSAFHPSSRGGTWRPGTRPQSALPPRRPSSSSLSSSLGLGPLAGGCGGGSGTDSPQTRRRPCSVWSHAKRWTTASLFVIVFLVGLVRGGRVDCVICVVRYRVLYVEIDRIEARTHRVAIHGTESVLWKTSWFRLSVRVRYCGANV